MTTHRNSRGRRPVNINRSPASTKSIAKDVGRTPTLSRGELNRPAPVWRDPTTGSTTNPMSQFRSWTEQMERFFNSFGLGAPGNRMGDWNMWSPQIETLQRGDQFIVRADLPGLNREDVNVEVTDDAVIIRGERRDEFQDEREGYFRSERSYGSFYRAVPIPAGAITEDVNASFKDGVLEITMPAPPAQTRGRKIEIGEGA